MSRDVVTCLHLFIVGHEVRDYPEILKAAIYPKHCKSDAFMSLS